MVPRKEAALTTLWYPVHDCHQQIPSPCEVLKKVRKLGHLMNNKTLQNYKEAIKYPFFSPKIYTNCNVQMNRPNTAQ